jgi:hypothetical protein
MRRSYRRGAAAAVLQGTLLCPALICGLVFAAAARAESVPASIRACTLETDSLKRLICFDREVARYSVQPSSSGDAKQAPPASPPAVDLRSQPTTPKVLPGPPREDRSDSGDQPAAAPAPTQLRHTVARILSIDKFPDAMVLHLDNDQVWEQIQEASADVNLRAGDTVSIDREMGSFWLSGSNGVAIKVKRKK